MSSDWIAPEVYVCLACVCLLLNCGILVSCERCWNFETRWWNSSLLLSIHSTNVCCLLCQNIFCDQTSAVNTQTGQHSFSKRKTILFTFTMWISLLAAFLFVWSLFVLFHSGSILVTLVINGRYQPQSQQVPYPAVMWWVRPAVWRGGLWYCAHFIQDWRLHTPHYQHHCLILRKTGVTILFLRRFCVSLA